MYCRTCHKELSEQAIICPECGCSPKAGNKFCPSCGQESGGSPGICLKCGCALGNITADLSGKSEKSRLSYILLGCLLGLFIPGVHNLYIGKTSTGLCQILMTICSCWILWVVTYIWSIIDVCNNLKDSDGKVLW